MSQISLRASLKKIGEPQSGQKIPAIFSGFHSAPNSLRAAMRAMNSPQIESWVNTHQSTFENFEWTEECQGLTTDGNSWFVSSNNEDLRAIYKFSMNFKTSLGHAELPDGFGSHIGDIDYHDGKIYVSVDGGIPLIVGFGGEVIKWLVEPKSVVWVLDTNLNTLEVTDLDPQIRFFMGWCAINPWNGFFYTSGGDNVNQIHAYEPKNKFAYKGSLNIRGSAVNGLQGGCFSSHGKLYLTSDRFVNEKGTKQIRAYSALNGAHFGSVHVSYDESTLEAEEMEGLAIVHFNHSGGDSSLVHVVILDNDAPSLDDVFLKHFAVPNPDDV